METKRAKCTKCAFEEEYEPDEMGLSYYQAMGKCPLCDAPTVDEDGKPTRELVSYTANTDRPLLMIVQRSRTSTEDPALFDGKRVKPVYTEGGTKYVDDDGNVWESVDNSDRNEFLLPSEVALQAIKEKYPNDKEYEPHYYQPKNLITLLRAAADWGIHWAWKHPLEQTSNTKSEPDGN